MEFVSRRDKEEVQRITDAYLTAHHDIGMMLEPDSTVFKGNEIRTEKAIQNLSKYLYVKPKKDDREYSIMDWIVKQLSATATIYKPYFVNADFLFQIINNLNFLVNYYRIDEKYYDSLYPEKEPQSFFS